MAAAPVAAEAPVLAYLVVGLLALLSYLVLRGLRVAWIYTFGAMLDSLADAITFSVLGQHYGFGGPIRSINHTIINSIELLAAKSEHTAGYLFHGAAVIQGWVARELLAFARDTYAWSLWLQKSHLPRWVKALIYAAVPPALILRLVRAAIDANLPHLGRVIERRVGLTRRQVKGMIAAAIAAAGSVSLPLPHVWPRVRGLERDLTGIKARLKKLERYGAATGAVALFVAALAKLGLKWIRCRNVTKAGKAICATDSSLLDSLLGDALLILSVVSVVEFTRELQAIEGEALGIAHRIIREFPSASAAA